MSGHVDALTPPEASSHQLHEASSSAHKARHAPGDGSHDDSAQGDSSVINKQQLRMSLSEPAAEAQQKEKSPADRFSAELDAVIEGLESPSGELHSHGHVSSPGVTSERGCL